MDVLRHPNKADNYHRSKLPSSENLPQWRRTICSQFNTLVPKKYESLT
jgi:hypothetical protein